MSNRFFEKINYSASNEDSESERIALQINPEDTVLCITGSGARSLDLLIDSPKQIVSIDFNASQNHLLELKIAAFKTLSYEEMLSFFGVRTATNRLETFKRLESLLSNEANAFWSVNLKDIERGIIYCGTWEKLLKGMLRFAFFRKSIIRKLFSANTLSEQSEIWKAKWNNGVWRFFLKIMSNRFLWVKIIREPGAQLIPKEFSVYDYMNNRLEHMSSRFQLKNNHFANLIFQGKYSENCILPHHLQEQNFERIKANIDRIQIVTDSLLDYLPEHENRFTKFSLSDFSSYAPTEMYSAIWNAVITSAEPSALFCERHFLVKRNPEMQFVNLRRNTDMENKLNLQDESFIYTFCTGEITQS